MQRTPELERRQKSCVARRFLHEVQYHTMGSITAVVAATAEEQVSPHHPRCVYHRTAAVQQSTAEKPIHQQPTIPPCVYNNSTVLWYGLGRPVITSEIGNWSVFVLLGWRFEFGFITKKRRARTASSDAITTLGIIKLLLYYVF